MGTVIKAGEVGPVKRRLAAVDLSDHLAEANSVIEHAHRQAAQITATAREEARAMLDQARREGHEAGYQTGHAEGTDTGRREAFEKATQQFTEQHGRLAAALAQAIESLESMKEDLLIAAERDVLSFAVDVARQLTFRIGSLHSESAGANLRRALDTVSTRTDITVFANPQDHETLETFASQLVEAGKTARHIAIVKEEGISPGGCRVEAGATSVDATLETQIADLVSLLVGEEARRD